MTTKPLHPSHADKTISIPGANPRLTCRRVLEDYAYPANGNVHNPTPHYLWLLLADGREVGLCMAVTRRAIFNEARNNGAAYLAEVQNTPAQADAIVAELLDKRDAHDRAADNAQAASTRAAKRGDQAQTADLMRLYHQQCEWMQIAEDAAADLNKRMGRTSHYDPRKVSGAAERVA